MRSLEDALAIVQISESDQPHPLLSSREELEADDGPTLQAVSEELSQSSSPVLPQAPGTLWTDERGSSRFFGPSGGAEVSGFNILSIFLLTKPLTFPKSLLMVSLTSPAIRVTDFSLPRLVFKRATFSKIRSRTSGT